MYAELKTLFKCQKKLKNFQLFKSLQEIFHIAYISYDISKPTSPACTNSQLYQYSTFYQNVSGMRSKTNDFKLFMSSREYDLIVITDTWLHTRCNNFKVYSHVRCLTPTSSSGVLIAVIADFKSEYFSL